MNNPHLSQLLHSDTAIEQGFNNSCFEENILQNLQNLSDKILQPVNKHFGGELHITSGYRCKPLNDFLGSTEESQHCLGEAVDFGIIDTDIHEIACWIRDHLDFDHLILEKYDPSDLNKGWIHCSYTTRYPLRKLVQSFDGKDYHDGLHADLRCS